MNGIVITKASYRLHFGEEIQVSLPKQKAKEPKDPQLKVPVIYEEEAFLIVDKPAGLIVHGAPSVKEETLVEALRAQGYQLPSVGGEERGGIVHRLDRDTSGLLVVARQEQSFYQLQRFIQAKRFEKYYACLVHGVPAQPFGEIWTGYGRHPKQRHKMCVLPRRQGVREARTYYTVQSKTETHAFLEVKLYTGRTHQIRVHLAYLGNPIVGDKVYGQSDPFPRQMLHAFFLAFPHPVTEKKMTFTSPLPADFRSAALKLHLSLKREG